MSIPTEGAGHEEGGLERRLDGLEQRVARVEIYLRIILGVSSTLALFVLGGVLWLNSTIAELKTLVKEQNQRLDRMESQFSAYEMRLSGYEKMEGPLGVRLNRIEGQIDRLNERITDQVKK